MEDEGKRVCPCCEGEYERNDMLYTRDCHGIVMKHLHTVYTN